jgi:methylated-DNA-[protein]-cysteine S-methyltransferase
MPHRISIDSPIGPLAIEANDAGAITGLSMSGWYRAVGQPSAKVHNDVLEVAANQIDAYFSGALHAFNVAIEPDGNAFQRSVWQCLLKIPYGETRSYGQIAEELGDRTLARAVGVACGANPIALIIPCHRIIGADGSLTGFGGGLERKEFLLHLENPERPLRPRLFA